MTFRFWYILVEESKLGQMGNLLGIDLGISQTKSTSRISIWKVLVLLRLPPWLKAS